MFFFNMDRQRELDLHYNSVNCTPLNLTDANSFEFVLQNRDILHETNRSTLIYFLTRTSVNSIAIDYRKVKILDVNT